jgi:hypothetical protein
MLRRLFYLFCAIAFAQNPTCNSENCPKESTYSSKSVRKPLDIPQYDYTQAHQYSLIFYFAQMLGKKPDWNPLNFRGDSYLKDGSDVGIDLSASYSDCGDTLQFALANSFALYTLALQGLHYKEEYQRIGEWDRFLKILTRGTDWWIAAHPEPYVLYAQVAEGTSNHQVWVMSEFGMEPRPTFKLTKDKPGSDLTGSVTATLALTSIIYRDINKTYSDLLLRHARELFDFTENYRGLWSDSIPSVKPFYTSSHHWDEEILAGLAMYWATGEKRYSDYAIQNSRTLVKMTLTWAMCHDDCSYTAVFLLWKLLKDKEAEDCLLRHFDHWLNSVPKTPGGMSWLTGWASNRYNTATGFLMMMYLDSHPNPNPVLKEKYEKFALTQVNYILGNNPYQTSYLNGFGEKYFNKIHHRNCHGSVSNNMSDPATNRHICGMLVGGPDIQDVFSDDITNFGQTESCMDTQAPFTGLLIALSKRFPGTPLRNFPPPEPVTQEYFVGGFISKSSDSSVQLNLQLKSEVAYPPRSEALCFRYYLYLEQNNVEVNSYYNEQADIGKLTRDNNNECIWYVPVCWKKGLIYPQSTSTSRKQAQLTIHLPYNNPSGTFDRSKDPSFQGLTSVFQDDLRNIPVYENGKLMVGNEPKGIKCGAKPSPSPSQSPTQPSVPTPPPTPPKPSPNPPNPPTPTPSPKPPTPNPSTTCSGLYQQCGGKSWSGPTCCVKKSVCQVTNEWYSQCVPTNEPLDPNDPDFKCSAVWQQCAGKSWSGPTCCQSGSVCQTTNEYYAQCIPGESTTPTTPTVTPVPSPEPTPLPSPVPTPLPNPRRRVCYECTLIRE